MADTVDASVIVASLGDTGPSFVTRGDLETFGAPVAIHVAGGASAPTLASGLGSPLLVDFGVLGAPADPTPLSPTVSGSGSMLDWQEFAPVVAGGLHQS